MLAVQTLPVAPHELGEVGTRMPKDVGKQAPNYITTSPGPAVPHRPQSEEFGVSVPALVSAPISICTHVSTPILSLTPSPIPAPQTTFVFPAPCTPGTGGCSRDACIHRDLLYPLVFPP